MERRRLAALAVLVVLSAAACASRPRAGEPRSFEATFRLDGWTEAEEERPGATPEPYRLVSRMSFLEPGTWREEILEEAPVVRGGPGSYTMARPGRFFEYRAATKLYTAGGGARRIENTIAEFADLGSAKWRTCERVGTGDEVAGRATTHLRCPPDQGGGELPRPEPAGEGAPAPNPPSVSPGGDFWIDTETGLVLKSITPSGPVTAEGSPTEPAVGPAVRTLTATSVRYGVRFPEKLFDLTPPPGAKSSEQADEEAQRRGSRTLSAGQEAPPWSAELLGGGRVELTALRGKPTVVLFWASWCQPCTGATLSDFDASARAHTGLHMLTVAWTDEAADVRRLVEQTGLRVSVALDEDGSIGEAWGLVGIPTYVFLNPDGRIVALHLERLATEELKTALDALAAGRPVRLD